MFYIINKCLLTKFSVNFNAAILTITVFQFDPMIIIDYDNNNSFVCFYLDRFISRKTVIAKLLLC